MTVEFREINCDDYEGLRNFLSELGWAKRVRDDDRFRAMLDGTDRAVVATEGQRIVGFARALTDGVSNGYISMVAVAADRRRQGIGRALVERLMSGDAARRITWVLRAGRDSSGFWARLGFSPSLITMERVRDDIDVE
jgi:ribosomal protein S18 acetylase RimI-like enzyme